MAERGGVWFQCGAQELHIGVDRNFHAATKAHPAFKMASVAALNELSAALRQAGHLVTVDTELPEFARFFANDPWGNRLEFLATRVA